MGSRFGRVPENTVNRYEQTVDLVRKQVVTSLPTTASDELQAYTLEQVLKTIFTDWQEHGNIDLLSAQDVQDLASFVEMAAALAGLQLNTSSRAVFEATLSGLLQDWLYNWNAEDQVLNS